MARGIERRRLFRDDVDREAFVARLDELCVEGEAALYAWCLLPNHFHLLLRTGAAPLSTLMRRLLTGYAGGFNRRHRRVGHLLQNRFKSIVVEEEPYLLELVRYIHLNAVRARVVDDSAALESYPWAGHGALLGGSKLRAHDVESVLAHFGRTQRSARAAYRQFVEEGERRGRRPDLAGGGLRRSRPGWVALDTLRRGRERWAADERILGSSEFVLRTLHELPAPARPLTNASETMATVLALVAERCAIDVQVLRSNSHRPRVVSARAIACYVAVVRYGLSPPAVAAELGISPRSVIRGLERAQQRLDAVPAVADLLG